MAKRKARGGAGKAKGRRKPAPAKRSAKRRATARRPAKTRARAKTARKPASHRKSQPTRRARPKKKAAAKQEPGRSPRLDRARRTLDESVVPSPPSSLNLDRHGSAARTGRQELAESQQLHKTMSPEIAAGDVDVNIEEAYFSGDEAPGGDNPTPDQDIVDDIGRAVGVEYQDNEELRTVDKVAKRDKNRWELDPASSEDYKERK